MTNQQDAAMVAAARALEAEYDKHNDVALYGLPYISAACITAYLAAREAEGIQPLEWPLGDNHHTDVPFAEEDIRLGDKLAYYMGTLFADVSHCQKPCWFYSESTPTNEWARVARALRIHGLCIAARPTNGDS